MFRKNIFKELVFNPTQAALIETTCLVTYVSSIRPATGVRAGGQMQPPPKPRKPHSMNPGTPA